MDQQCLGQLDFNFKSAVNLANQEIKCLPIEKNPFYIPYDCTDLYLWRKESNLSQLKLKTLKKKNILRKPILQRLQTQSQAHGKDWLKQCKSDLECEITWVNSLDIKKVDKTRAYSMSDLQDECERIPYNAGDIDIDEILIPKRMSEMAKTMYIKPYVKNPSLTNSKEIDLKR
ncbi:PREDICTED: uncharacterized protein LOC108615577 [Drosophila arizonae]|uniref:Uncharacterized protein LOC108615577 n=1 Tax=Drosophila arizonae TaxID=7263 RepID=A0ABM1PEJ6_DROAR|nr:PREDICTED: uncharacterized protein LOC108615577 [Drosophila arizonae]